MICEIMIKNGILLNADCELEKNKRIVINNSRILDICTAKDAEKYKPKTMIDAKNKLIMPGLVDAHSHTCQQFLRGKIMDEYPMIWTRIMVPFESNLDKMDVLSSGRLACLEMIKSGTTTFADAGGQHMEQIVRCVGELGLRASITRSTMDKGNIPDTMKDTTRNAIVKAEELFNRFDKSYEQRVSIWFGIRSILSCSQELMEAMGYMSKQYNTGLHVHMNEYTNEVLYCLENYRKRPVEFLDSLGVISDKFLSAHSLMLSENEIDILSDRHAKVVHCPRSNFGKAVPKTPQLLKRKISVGMGSDGSAHQGLSLFDEAKVFRAGMYLHHGINSCNPVVMPAKTILAMMTIGGAEALLMQEDIGTIEKGKKADLIMIDMDKPHIMPTHNIVHALIESVNSNDVTDMIVDGKVIMKDRNVLTLDEEKILYESKIKFKNIAKKAGMGVWYE